MTPQEAYARFMKKLTECVLGADGSMDASVAFAMRVAYEAFLAAGEPDPQSAAFAVARSLAGNAAKAVTEREAKPEQEPTSQFRPQDEPIRLWGEDKEKSNMPISVASYVEYLRRTLPRQIRVEHESYPQALTLVGHVSEWQDQGLVIIDYNVPGMIFPIRIVIDPDQERRTAEEIEDMVRSAVLCNIAMSTEPLPVRKVTARPAAPSTGVVQDDA